MINRWRVDKSSFYNIGYHLIWCSKYRRKVLVGNIELRLKDILLNTAEELNVYIDNITVFPDYVHLVVRANPAVSPAGIIAQFKSKSSNKLRHEFSELKTRIPTLWTRSYYVESIGNVSVDNILRFIESQKGK